MGAVIITISFAIVIGLLLYFLINHLTNIVKKNYIFDVKLIKKKGDKLEFSNDYYNHKIPMIKLSFNGQKYNFLLDTGADVNIMNKSVFDEISNNLIPVKSNGLIITAGLDVTSEKADLSFKYRNTNFVEEFVLLDLDTSFKNILENKNIQLHGVLGSDFFKKHRWSVDFDNMVVWTK